MTKIYIINKGQKPTPKQLQEVEEAKKSSIVTDEDAPELSAALYKAFKCSVIRHNRRNELNTSQYRLFKQTDWALFGGKNEKREYSCI